jgi:hypothetical protein
MSSSVHAHFEATAFPITGATAIRANHRLVPTIGTNVLLLLKEFWDSRWQVTMTLDTV